MHYKYLNVMDEECEYLKNYLTHETKFLDYIKTNEEKQQARMNSIMNTFDNLDKALGTSLKYRSHIGPILEDTFRNFSSDFGESFKIEAACGNTLVSLELIFMFRCM